MNIPNPFRSFGMTRAAKRIADSLERANILKQAELDAQGIPYPIKKPTRGADVEVEVSYTDPEEQAIEEFMVQQGMIPKTREEE